MEEQSPIREPLSKSSTDLDQQSLLALVSVRAPTPDKCAVCLNNKQTDIIARIDSCSHTFCFPCILEWSKVRAICPLCKQPFNVITRERYSGDIVEEIRVQAPRQASSTTFANLNDVLTWVDQHRTRSENPTDTGRRNDIFRQMVYIEWLNTVQAIVRRPNNTSRNTSLSPLVRAANSSSSWSNLIPPDSIRRLLHRYLRQTTSDLRQSTIYSQSTRQTVAFRKYIYLNRLFVHSPLVGHNRDTLTVRECSPTWYASNPACLHRLVPFLARELLALLWNDERTIEHVIQEILTSIQLHEIRSNFLTRKLNEYLGRYTKHFLHEFYTFARCPYDLAGFDRHAQYPTMNTSSQVIPPMQISLDDDDDDDDDDIIDQGDERTPIILDETPDMSGDITDITSASSPQTIIDSEQRSSSPECEIVEYVEPTRERTPSLIVLSEDDEDEDDHSQIHVASSSTKRKHSDHHGKSKKQQATTGGTSSPTSVILEDDDDEPPQSDDTIPEQSSEDAER